MRSGSTLLLVACCCTVALSACSGGAREPTVAGAGTGAGGEVSTAPSPTDPHVRLALYFRAGDGEHAHLERVTRRVPVGRDLPRQALEMLIAGPTVEEAGLAATLPDSTLVHEVDVRDGTAHVVLSGDVVHDALRVGESPANEALALGAITNTLTEFPSVERVRLEVDGLALADGRFWGGWGLPAVLVRDESLVGEPASGDGVPELGRFSNEAQTIGSSEVDAVVLSAIRVRDKLTHVRVILELGSAHDRDAFVKLPRVRARSTNDEIVLDLTGVSSVVADLVEGRALELSDVAFKELRVEPADRVTAVRLAVDGARERRFWLHSLSEPARVVLDVKK